MHTEDVQDPVSLRFLISSLQIYIGILVGGSEIDRPLHSAVSSDSTNQSHHFNQVFQSYFHQRVKRQSRPASHLTHIAHNSLHKQG